jgi:hypothetical protein
MTSTPEDDNEPTAGHGMDGSADTPDAVHGSVRRLHPREFFGEEEWERRRRGPEPQLHEPEPEQPLSELEETPRPADGTGIVAVERRVDVDAWTVDWIGPLVDDVVTTGLAGPHRGSLEDCVAWALNETKPAQIIIHLV